MIGRYENSPKVKYREGICGASQLIAELKVLRRDRVSISLRSCVDFARSAQAEIVCRFRRDRVSISSEVRKPRSCVDFAEMIDWGSLETGSDLKIFAEVENCWKERDYYLGS